MNAKQIKRSNSLARWAVPLKECKESGLQVREGALLIYSSKKTLDILPELYTIK